MNITFTFDTSNQRDNQILSIMLTHMADVMEGQKGAPVTTQPTQPTEAPRTEPMAEPQADKPKRGRKPKTEATEPEAPAEQPEVRSGQEWAEVAKEPEPETKPAETPEEALIKTITLDDVRGALQAFTAEKGVPAGIELLKKFNAGRISELDAANYAAFVQACAA